jgi:hypothetical protein
MPPILNDLGQYGILGLLMLAVVYITILIIKKLPSKSDDNFSKTLQSISDAIISHNERAMENHKILITHFANTMHDHEKIMDATMKILMSITLQDKAIEQFQREIADIKCGISNLRERMK